MSSLSRFTAAAAALVFAGIAIPGGCASNADQGSGFDDGTGSTGTGASGTGASTGRDDAGNVIGLGDGAPPGPDGPQNFDGGLDGGCAGFSVPVELTPVNLIFIVDKSGSMGHPEQSAAGDRAKRWDPMVAAFNTFFNSVTSPAMKASFTFFPAPANLDVDAGGGDVCKASEYNPDTVQANSGSTVRLTQIAGRQKTFTDLLNDNEPNGGTPTIAALQGSYTYALSVQAASPAGVTYVVLITDGAPGFGYCPLANGCPGGVGAVGTPGCTGNDIATITALAQSYANQGIKTYVFGMGGIANLDRIATAGGNPLVTISIGDPAATTQQFLDVLNRIPKPVFSCTHPIPPKDGLDLNKVNVFYTNSASTDQHLIPNNPSCSRGDKKSGWYMQGNNIELCQVTCDALKADPSSSLSVQFDCLTVVVPE
jgi:hypothetical protein